MKILWTKTAESLLDGIYNFIQIHNNVAAIEIYNNILDESLKLAKFPQLGFIEPLLLDFSEEYRSLIVHRIYKIVYYIDNQTKKIYIVAVFDCRQKPKKLQDIVRNN